jgi:hypothetical protein
MIFASIVFSLIVRLPTSEYFVYYMITDKTQIYIHPLKSILVII